ncbi:hypothetical protein ACFVUW_10645 [Streptomyces xiamenensis]|uniref:hypothetical protein n=1 Tax=Streptomyces xiamenensis TaxID=408015 RepID=UPI0036EF112D
MVVIDGANFGYVVVRRNQEEKSAEFGFHAFGPDGSGFAERLAGIVRTWGKEHRNSPGPRIAVYPAQRLTSRFVSTNRTRGRPVARAESVRSLVR